MRTRHAQHPLVPQQRIRQPLRAGSVRQVAVEDFFHQRIAARHHIADDEHIRLECKLLHAEALDEFDALPFELCAHRRIDVRIAAGDAIARLFGDGRDAAHECAADTEDMDVFWFAHRAYVLKIKNTAPIRHSPAYR